RSDLLVAVCDSELLPNWRESLAAPYAEAPPWWLDDAYWTRRSGELLGEGRRPRSTASTDAWEPTSTGRIHHLSADWRPAPALAMGASGPFDGTLRVDFVSERDEARQVIATVAAPPRLDERQELLVDVRFAFVDRNPGVVRRGSVVRLGGVTHGVVVERLSLDSPRLLQASVRLSSEDVDRLLSDRQLCLSVDGRLWLVRDSHGSDQ
ncbi:MAG: hypothetical protein KDA61_10430, partial [Planctomycetales bacterium]|nr:hypothetical protein [Planctomycetales bacterium]